MKIYTTLSDESFSSGFYSDAVHGPRRLTIPDPAYVRRQIEVDKQVEKIMMVTEDGVETQVLVQVIEQVLVDDPTDIPPQIDGGPNPDTKIPSDAIEITEERYQELIGNRGGGQRKVVIVDGVATLAPYTPPPPPLADVQAAKRSEINAARESAIGAGVAWNAHLWDSDARSRQNLIGVVAAVNAGIPLPPGFTWRTQDNQDIPMTGADLVGLSGAMLQHVNAQYVRSWDLKAQVDAALTSAEVRAVQW